MAWWLEDATSRHFGWVRNPSEAFFFTFLEPGKKSEIFFSRKNREKSVFFRKKSGFIGNYRDFSEKSAIFRRNFFKRFFHGFFFSTPADNRKIDEKSADFFDFLFPATTLPPLRDLQHNIDLILGASIPNRAHYRLSPIEHEILQGQGNDLLQKGFIRKSKIPYASSTFLVEKKN